MFLFRSMMNQLKHGQILVGEYSLSLSILMHCNYEETVSVMWFLSLPVNLTIFSLSKILKQQRLE